MRCWGVSVTGPEQRMSGWQPENVAYVPERPERLKRSKEEGVDLILALCGGGGITTNVNVPNRGQIPWLPTGHVVETLSAVARDRVCPQVIGEFPAGLQAHLARVAGVQAMTLEAALTRDRDLALHALLADPLCLLDTAAAAGLLDELIAANRAHLPEGW